VVEDLAAPDPVRLAALHRARQARAAQRARPAVRFGQFQLVRPVGEPQLRVALARQQAIDCLPGQGSAGAMGGSWLGLMAAIRPSGRRALRARDTLRREWQAGRHPKVPSRVESWPGVPACPLTRTIIRMGGAVDDYRWVYDVAGVDLAELPQLYRWERSHRTRWPARTTPGAKDSTLTRTLE
jgi:hypothetical protein